MPDYHEPFIFKHIPDNEQDIKIFLNKNDRARCKCNYDQRFGGLIKEDKNKLDSIIKETYLYAIMASNAYDRQLQIKIPGWSRVNRVITNNDFSADIYLSEDEQTVAVSFRGTDSLKDFTRANLLIDFDRKLKGQYSDSDELIKQIKSTYPNKKIIAIRHSLGGGLAIHISLMNHGIDAYTFNTSPRVFAIDGYKHKNRILVIHESGEVLNLARKLFFTLYKIQHESYRLNFLGGNPITEHSIESLARCMTQYANMLKLFERHPNGLI